LSDVIVVRHHIDLAEVINRCARQAMHIFTAGDISLASITDYPIDDNVLRL
jgi:hypothetical protein